MGLLRAAGSVYKPVEELDLGPDSKELYVEANIKAPIMGGFLAKIFAWTLEAGIFGTLVLYIMKRINRVHEFISHAKLEEPPMFVPLHPFVELHEQEVIEIHPDASPAEKVQRATVCLPSTLENSLESLKPGYFRRWTVMDYSRAYRSGEITPLKVAERFIDAVRESSRRPLPVSFFINYDAEDILRQATESTLRYERGAPISVLDGVPMAVKDEIDCSPYPTAGGTKWLHRVRPCTGDACCFARLRSCGAILVGKSNMHELGVTPSGTNPHYGAPRNPYDPNKISGGSSSGSAAVVSAGLCPAALGVDGGGSVRMPASLSGVVGFKPTFGRIPQSGVLPLNWTVGMVGILAGTIEDAFIVYAAVSGQLPSDETTTLPPKVYFPLLNSTNQISNIKLARYGAWFNDCDEEVRLCCSNALHFLCERYNWKTVEVTILEIEVMRQAHYVTIGSECSTSLSSYLENLDRSEMGWDARIVVDIYGAFDSNEYIKAQKLRYRHMQIHNKIFTKAEVVVTPTTGMTAYPISKAALKTGELDYINGANIIRYQIAGNFLGLPAITVPVGYDKAGLPIGLQFIGKPWSEPTLMHIALAMQALCITDYRKPKVFYDILDKK
ncbi:fatty acid amide hydrolase-like [Hibiscus syriacus]|uniref:fatty acid amide hydrolase-like n=1 Tax=Hibiscus syriacus TaxID=106335 RepID=UPI001922129C|nr:fatty acid amide hydrolase-like [Hibiscus syriacus]